MLPAALLGLPPLALPPPHTLLHWLHASLTSSAEHFLLSTSAERLCCTHLGPHGCISGTRGHRSLASLHSLPRGLCSARPPPPLPFTGVERRVARLSQPGSDQGSCSLGSKATPRLATGACWPEGGGGQRQKSKSAERVKPALEASLANDAAAAGPS